MKIINYMMLLLTVSFVVSCTDDKKNDDIFNEFEGDKGVYMIKLPPALFMKLIGMDNEDIDSENLGDISLVKLLIYSRENDTDEDVQAMLGRVKEQINNYEYENILGFDSSEAFISAYILENEDYVSDLMLLVKEDMSLICLGLSGKLDGREIFKFASKLEYDKLRNFIDEN